MKKLLVLWFMMLLVLPIEAKPREITSRPEFMYTRQSHSLAAVQAQAWPLAEVLKLVDPCAYVEIELNNDGSQYTIHRTDLPKLVLQQSSQGWQLKSQDESYWLSKEEVRLDNEQLLVSLRFLNRFFPERFIYNTELTVDKNFRKHIVIEATTSQPDLSATTLTSFPAQTIKLDPTLVQLAYKSLPIPLEFLHNHQVFVYPFQVTNAVGGTINAVTFPTNKTYLFSQQLLYESSYHETITHELGHQLLFHLKDERLLHKYLKVRGLTNTKVFNNKADTAYQNRIHEIFAEDFRMLFGNIYATSLPHINQDLPPPAQILGLKEVITELIESVQDQS